MAWIYGTDWIRRLGNGIKGTYDDAVDLTAAAIAPIVNPLADGRPMDALRYATHINPIVGYLDQDFKVNPKDEYKINPKNGIVEKYNDAVEITAVAVAPIVNPIAEGRPTDAAKYLVNKTYLGAAMSPLGAVLFYDPKFEVKKGDEYTPEIYRQAEAYYKRGIPAHATQRQLHEAVVGGYEMNAKVQKKTADFQDAAIDIMTLPANILTAGASLPVMLAGDVAINEGTHAFVNSVLPGDRPGDTLGSRLVNWAVPGSVKPSATTLAMEELERAKNNPNLAGIFEEEHAKEAAELKRKIYAKYGLNPDGTPLNNTVATTQEQNGNSQTQGNNNAEPGLLSKIGEIIASIWKSIVGFFHGAGSQPQTVVAHPVPQNLNQAPANPVSGLSAQVQNTQDQNTGRGK